MKQTKNYRMKQPEVNVDYIDDLVDAVGYNANLCDDKFNNIFNNRFNTKGFTLWDTNPSIDFAANNNSNHQARIISWAGNQPKGNIFIEPQSYLCIRSFLSTPSANNPVHMVLYGDLSVTGQKQRAVDTKTYGKIGLNAIESAESYFVDVYRGKTQNGQYQIQFDKKWAETVDLSVGYDVHLCKYGQGDIWTDYDSMNKKGFLVCAENDIKFSAFVYAKQLNYADVRLNKVQTEEDEKKIEEYRQLYYKDKLNNLENSGE